ncbi:ATP-binding protein [uncultured Bifidobacterium sp.]|uniref:sensor histidine kinase n=1 Tax=uncultured Bifidobacterium sp. TaxID=165187 RepID=UPI0028DCD2F6|nr:ATP-binding protein [uncultured Bifidobacterium sp.]
MDSTLTPVVVAAACLAVAVLAFALGRVAARPPAAPAGFDGVDATTPTLFGEGVDVGEAERHLVEVMPLAMMLVGATGIVRYVSPAASALGVAQGGRLVAPEVEDILARVVSDGRVREREVTVTRRPRADRDSGRGVPAGQGPAGRSAHLSVRVGPVAPDRFAVFIKDVSEQRRFESMRRDFVTNVSHELKTPAGAISLLAETISDAADDPQAVRYFSGRVSTEARRLIELVGHLIDLQRADIANPLLSMAPVPALEIVRDAVSQNMVQAKAKHIDIRISLAGRSVDLLAPREGSVDEGSGRCAVMADREAITTAVKNLVENAIRYSEQGTTVGVGIVRSEARVMIRVVDQGIGIPAEALGRIFERFYRVDPARSRETGGSGLGLAITKHCVQECGGRISVWSREGEGSTFTIDLPAAEGCDGSAASGAGSASVVGAAAVDSSQADASGVVTSTGPSSEGAQGCASPCAPHAGTTA